jgi:NAD dependent epimerase/dehydratase family enzyme
MTQFRLSAGGTCFYGSQAFRQSEQYHDRDERSEPVGIDYPAKLWAQAADGMTNTAVRHVKLRLGLFLRAIDNTSLQGVFNVGSPGIVSNQNFAELLAAKLGRSVLARVPAALIKAVVGNAAIFRAVK